MENLWGELIDKKINTPKKILEEQSNYLEDMTKGYVYAEVIRRKNEERPQFGEFVFHYLLKSRYLEEYSYKLLELSHSVNIYPVFITLDEFVYDEIKSTSKIFDEFDTDDNDFYVKASNEEEFIEVLRTILSSKEVINIVSGIITVSNDYA